MRKRHRRSVAVALGIQAVGGLGAVAVTAQDLLVNVTGSNIKRLNTETAAPVEVITREDIEASGLQTISDLSVLIADQLPIADRFIAWCSERFSSFAFRHLVMRVGFSEVSGCGPTADGR